MTAKSSYVLLLGLILIVCVFLAGCSSQSSTTTTSKITTQPAPKYTAGDIVSNNASSTFWLILSYDSGSDLYTRAQVEKNPDGSYNQITGVQDSFPRMDMENLYPVFITQVSVASVPVATTTIPTTVITTLSGSGPLVTAVSPSTGATGTSVSLTITGTNFLSGATVQLVQAGLQPIAASSVSVTSAQITCSVNLGSLTAGPAYVQVINPDGRSAMSSFTVGEPTPVISSISPTSGYQGSSYTLTVYGQTLTDVQLVTLLSADGTDSISCTSPSPSATSTSCTLAIPSTAEFGLYSVSALSSDGTNGTLSSAFTVENATTST